MSGIERVLTEVATEDIQTSAPDLPDTNVCFAGISDEVIRIEPEPGVYVDLSGRMLARNTMLNLVGQVAPLLVAALTVPYVLHHLGPDRYGLYSLASIVVGYFALFNLGIGPATTKYVAEYLGSGEIERLPHLVWTAVTSQMCLGLAGGTLLAAASPLLIERALKIPLSLRSEAHIIFLVMAAALPLDFVAGSFRGVLSASQRFDLLNSIDVPLGVLMGLVPMTAIVFGYSLPAIVLCLILLRLASVLVVIVLCFRLHPALRNVCFEVDLIRPLLSFGGWVTVSGAVGPILVYVDQLLIGTILSISAVGFYAPPYNIASKLAILPGCLVSTLFPAFSTSVGRGDSEWIRKTLIRSLKFLILIVGPITLMLVFFSQPLLTFWLGDKFAREGVVPLQILAGGVLVNSLAYVPANLLTGVGRPDLNAKFHLLELPIHLVLTWLLVTHFGLSGAAMAWTIRVTLDFVLLLAAACWVTRTPPRLLVRRDLGSSFGALAFLAVGFVLLGFSTRVFVVDAVFTLLISGGFLYTAWGYVLNVEEKCQIRLWLKIAS